MELILWEVRNIIQTSNSANPNKINFTAVGLLYPMNSLSVTLEQMKIIALTLFWQSMTCKCEWDYVFKLRYYYELVNRVPTALYSARKVKI